MSFNVNDHGHWEGPTFIFEPPITVDGLPMRRITIMRDGLPPDISPDDVISALTNQVATAELVTDETELDEIGGPLTFYDPFTWER